MPEVEFKWTLDDGRKIEVYAGGDYFPEEVFESGYVSEAHVNGLHIDAYDAETHDPVPGISQKEMAQIEDYAFTMIADDFKFNAGVSA